MTISASSFHSSAAAGVDDEDDDDGGAGIFNGTAGCKGGEEEALRASIKDFFIVLVIYPRRSFQASSISGVHSSPKDGRMADKNWGPMYCETSIMSATAQKKKPKKNIESSRSSNKTTKREKPS